VAFKTSQLHHLTLSRLPGILKYDKVTQGPVPAAMLVRLIRENGPRLRVIDMSGTAVTGTSIVSISRHAHHVQQVDLSFCRQVTDEAIRLLADECPQLQRLVVWGCTQLTERFFLTHKRAQEDSNSSSDTTQATHLRIYGKPGDHFPAPEYAN
jgi:hypothetical protein